MKSSSEPLGGAHRDPVSMAEALLNALVDQLQQLEEIPLTELCARRQRRFESIGSFREV